MATAKSNRSAGRIAGPPARGRSRPDSHRFRVEEDVSTAPDTPPAEWLRDLSALGLRLRVIYGTAITAELALRRQGAEQDPEIADCVREGLCNPLSDEIDRLEAVIQHLSSLRRHAND